MMRYASLGSRRFNASSLRKTSGIDVISGAYIFGSAEQQLTADALINAQSFYAASAVVSGALSPGTLYNISQIYDASASAGNAIDASLFSNESAFRSHGLSSEYDIVASRVDGTQQFFSGSVYHVLVASKFNSESKHFQPFVSLTLTAGLMDNLQVFPAHVAKTTGKVRPIDSSYSVTQISPYFQSEIIDSSF